MIKRFWAYNLRRAVCSQLFIHIGFVAFDQYGLLYYYLIVIFPRPNYRIILHTRIVFLTGSACGQVVFDVESVYGVVQKLVEEEQEEKEQEEEEKEQEEKHSQSLLY